MPTGKGKVGTDRMKNGKAIKPAHLQLEEIKPLSTRLRVANPEVIKIASENYTRLCSNPLDRLSDLLLDWDMLGSYPSNDTSSSSAITSTSARDGKLVPLPLIYDSFQRYIEYWEPLLIQEIKAAAMTNFQAIPSKKVLTGTARISPYQDIPRTKTVSIDAIFSSNHGPNTPDAMPSPMDLLLIFRDPSNAPSRSNGRWTSGQICGVSLVTSTSTIEKVKHYQLMMSSKYWMKLRGKDSKSDLEDKYVLGKDIFEPDNKG